MCELFTRYFSFLSLHEGYQSCNTIEQSMYAETFVSKWSKHHNFSSCPNVSSLQSGFSSLINLEKHDHDQNKRLNSVRNTRSGYQSFLFFLYFFVFFDKCPPFFQSCRFLHSKFWFFMSLNSQNAIFSYN